MTPPVWKADLVSTLGLAAVAWFIGHWLVGRSRFLRRSNIPAPAIGGLLFALVVLALTSRATVSIDTTLRAPLQIAFFTTIGFKATTSLLRAGGWRMVVFWLIASGTAVVQNVVGVAVARLTGAPPLLGIICGSLTLTGGPATGLAFTETFEKLGIAGAGELIIASATAGIFMASLIGNPVATVLIRRFGLVATASQGTRPAQVSHAALTAPALLQNLFVLLVVMALGVAGGEALGRVGITMPAFIVPMILAAGVRWFDDRSSGLGLDGPALETIGTVALALFFLIALMDLKLWQLATLAVPMVAILLVQAVTTVLYCVLTTFLIMGRDYEAAVMTSGHIGFGLGITPNAVANMDALTLRYGPAPVSFLIVPVIGAFFIDFSNPIIVTLSAALLR
jgi:glutamate:Na+ symporter, ESS family